MSSGHPRVGEYRLAVKIIRRDDQALEDCLIREATHLRAGRRASKGASHAYYASGPLRRDAEEGLLLAALERAQRHQRGEASRVLLATLIKHLELRRGAATSKRFQKRIGE